MCEESKKRFILGKVGVFLYWWLGWVHSENLKSHGRCRGVGLHFILGRVTKKADPCIITLYFLPLTSEDLLLRSVSPGNQKMQLEQRFIDSDGNIQLARNLGNKG